MTIQAQYQDNTIYVQLNGEIDEYNAASARWEADKIAEHYATRSQRAVFDLQGVSFMDSTGIGFLIGRYKKFRRFGVPVYVINPSSATDRILTMSGIYTLMPKL